MTDPEDMKEQLEWLREQNETYQVALQNIATGMRGVDDGSHEKMAARFIDSAKRALALRTSSASGEEPK